MPLPYYYATTLMFQAFVSRLDSILLDLIHNFQHHRRLYYYNQYTNQLFHNLLMKWLRNFLRSNDLLTIHKHFYILADFHTTYFYEKRHSLAGQYNQFLHSHTLFHQRWLHSILTHFSLEIYRQ